MKFGKGICKEAYGSKSSFSFLKESGEIIVMLMSSSRHKGMASKIQVEVVVLSGSKDMETGDKAGWELE